jgi:putative hydrolase of the HAD superfamily
VLLDLDDTILADSVVASRHWKDACLEHAPDRPGLDPLLLHDAIERARQWFWSDARRHRTGRLDQDAARFEIARLALTALGVDDDVLAERLAGTHSERRHAGAHLLPGALETVAWFRRRGSRTALLTNGAAGAQRAKVERFGLSRLFDLVLIEGELGYGKPDPRIYRLALRRLGVTASEAWMAGDNLEWDVAQPQRMGIFGIWIDVRGAGLPASSQVRPDRIVRALADLADLAE